MHRAWQGLQSQAQRGSPAPLRSTAHPLLRSALHSKAADQGWATEPEVIPLPVSLRQNHPRIKGTDQRAEHRFVAQGLAPGHRGQDTGCGGAVSKQPPLRACGQETPGHPPGSPPAALIKSLLGVCFPNSGERSPLQNPVPRHDPAQAVCGSVVT